MSKTYSEKLLDPRWQKKRLEIFERDNWTCVSCDRNCLENKLTVHVHHIRYLPNLDPWEYADSMLVTYCELCHNTEHLIGKEINQCLLDVIQNNAVYVKPVSQICTLVEKWPDFYDLLKWFLNESMISYLKTKQPS